jgi:hypothetical protein
MELCCRRLSFPGDLGYPVVAIKVVGRIPFACFLNYVGGYFLLIDGAVLINWEDAGRSRSPSASHNIDCKQNNKNYSTLDEK